MSSTCHREHDSGPTDQAGDAVLVQAPPTLKMMGATHDANETTEAGSANSVGCDDARDPESTDAPMRRDGSADRLSECETLQCDAGEHQDEAANQFAQNSVRRTAEVAVLCVHHLGTAAGAASSSGASQSAPSIKAVDVEASDATSSSCFSSSFASSTANSAPHTPLTATASRIYVTSTPPRTMSAGGLVDKGSASPSSPPTCGGSMGARASSAPNLCTIQAAANSAAVGRTPTRPLPPLLPAADFGFRAPDVSSSMSLQRMCPKKLWQRDVDATACSMASCGATFDWKVRRHHCRQCGRIVCSECSRGQKKLLGDDSSIGSPRAVRVCTGCMQDSETFSFASSPRTPKGTLLARVIKRHAIAGEQSIRKHGSSENLLERVAFTALSKGFSLSPWASPVASLEGAKAARGAKPPSLEDQGLSMALTTAMASSQSSSNESHQGSAPAEGSSERSGVVFVDFNRSRNNAMKCKRSAAEEPIVKDETRGGAQDRMSKFQSDLESSSYYQGLLEHEPAALKALSDDIFNNMLARAERDV